MREILFAKVEDVVMSMPQNKALGLYAFALDFFQACWLFIGVEVHTLVEESICSQ